MSATLSEANDDTSQRQRQHGKKYPPKQMTDSIGNEEENTNFESFIVDEEHEPHKVAASATTTVAHTQKTLDSCVQIK